MEGLLPIYGRIWRPDILSVLWEGIYVCHAIEEHGGHFVFIFNLPPAHPRGASCFLRGPDSDSIIRPMKHRL